MNVISLERTVGIIAFVSNLKSQESLAPARIDIEAENKTALYIGSISLKLKFIEKKLKIVNRKQIILKIH